MREKGSARGAVEGRGEVVSVGGTRAAKKAEYISRIGTAARINEIGETGDETGAPESAAVLGRWMVERTRIIDRYLCKSFYFVTVSERTKSNFPP